MITKVYEDFSGGWYGTLDPGKVPATMFDSRNMIVYRDGSLGPRPGLRAFNIGRTTGGKIYTAVHTGSPLIPFVYVDGTTVWSVSDDNAGTGSTNLGTISAIPSNDWPVKSYRSPDGQTFLQIPVSPSGGQIYQVLPIGIQSLTTSGGLASAPYGIRMMRGDISTMRLYYSEENDLDTWDAANYIQLGFSGQIVYMSEQRNHLTIVQSRGSWFVLTGIPGVNETLRRISSALVVPSPIGMDAVVDVGDDLLHYLSPVNNYPGYFDGVEHHELPYLTMTPEDPQASYAIDSLEVHRQVRALQAADNGSPLFIMRAPTNRMLLKHNGVWTLHQFSVDVGQAWASNGRGRLFGFAPMKSGSNTQPYTTDLRLNRPAFTSDVMAQPGDGSNTPVDAYVIFPEEWSDSGDRVRVNEVIVDITKWNTGVTNNEMTVSVDAIARHSEIVDGTFSRTWTQAGSVASASGTKDRVRFPFGPQGEGAGYRVRITGVKGVAIRKVYVDAVPIQADRRSY